MSKVPNSALRLCNSSTVCRLKPHFGAVGSPFMKTMHFEALINFFNRTSNGSVFLIDEISHAVSTLGKILFDYFGLE
jgi:hypothetical protein